MDVFEMAAKRAEALTKGGWKIKAVCTAKDPPPGFPKRHVLVIRMNEVDPEQRDKVISHAQGTDDWLVLLDFGKGYVSNGMYGAQSMEHLTKFIQENPPVMVWESRTERILRTRSQRKQ